MKKLLMLVLVLWAAGAYSQEIRMPDEKRKEYVNEREANKTTSNQLEVDEERKRRAEQARNQRAEAQQSRIVTKGNSVYCIIREMSDLNNPKAKVMINVDERMADRVKKMEGAAQKQVMMAFDKRAYSSGLEALGSFTQSNWSLVETSVYTWQEMAVREYLMEYELPVR